MRSAPQPQPAGPGAQRVSLQQQQHRQRNWDTEPNAPMRKAVTCEILRLFQRKKPNVMDEWRDKLPEFIRRLEDALYRTARSMEEYADGRTLEKRLQTVAEKLVQRVHRSNGGECATQPTTVQLFNGLLKREDVGNSPLRAVGGGASFGHAQVPGTPPWIGGQQCGPIGVSGGAQGVGNPAMGAMRSGALDRAARPVMGLSPTGFNGDYTASALSPAARGLGGVVGRGTANQSAGNVPVMRNGVPIVLPRGQGDWGPVVAPALVPANPVGDSVIPSPFGTSADDPGTLLRNQQQQQQPQPQQQRGPLGVPTDLGMIPITAQEKPSPGGMHMPQPLQTLSRTHPPQGGGMQGGQNRFPLLQEDVVGNPMRPVVPTNPLRTFASQQPASEPLLMQVPTSVTVPPNRSADVGNQYKANNQGVGNTSLMNLRIPGIDLSGQTPEIVKRKLGNYQKWLVFLRHTAKCSLPETACVYGENCLKGRELWSHLFKCKNDDCRFLRCHLSRNLLRHHCQCQNDRCILCVPVKDQVNKMRQHALEQNCRQHQMAPQPSQTRPGVAGPNMPSHMNVMQHIPPGSQQGMQPGMRVPSPLQQMAAPILQGSGQKRSYSLAMSASASSPLPMSPLGLNTLSDLPDGGGLHVPVQVVPVSETTPKNALGLGEQPSKRRKSMMQPSSMLKTLGTSLLEVFTVGEIQRHLQVQRATIPPPKKDNNIPANPEDCCTVCGQGDLLFEPPCIYCDLCYQRIKRHQVYYTNIQTNDQVKVSFCHQCYVSAAKGDVLTVGQSQFRKSMDLMKMKNEEQVSEPWVQCDQCQVWVHQVCGLFNKGQNGQETHYLCPTCLMDGLKAGTRVPMHPRSKSMLGAPDLPKCQLSNYLEDRLKKSLERERSERAMSQGYEIGEVPEVDGLTVRVVNNVHKKCEVLPTFLEAFKDKGMPAELPYKQKVIMLFQRLDGVDVCLYCLYVQEYGEDCLPPNRNWVHLSYIDSVRYFRPDIQAANGTSLRTFVYHEILVGYMAYVKKLGFNSMFIWACPPCQQGDDYILYSHPPKQRIPNNERLRSWYMEMLQGAKREGIVKHVSNLFDMYFEGGKDHNCESFSPTAVPYFDGDYWPGEVEKLVKEITESGAQSDRKGKAGARPSSNKRKARGRGNSVEEQLMQCIVNGQPAPQWEDFIVVHLREPCSFCRGYITEGPRYVYEPPAGGTRPVQERKFEGIRLDNPSGSRSGPVDHFQLCEACYGGVCKNVAAGFPTGLPAGIAVDCLKWREVEVIDVARDPDIVMPCEVLEQRQMFLSLCKGNHYQFDTLRRAKHSSMMVLYHLHNPLAPAFAATCNLCQREMEPGQGLRCSVCSDFDMCRACKEAGKTHEHRLVPQRQSTQQGSDAGGHRTRNDADLKRRKHAFERKLKHLAHAFTCQNARCIPACEYIKRLWQHLRRCPTSVRGGCPDCQKMWSFLHLHARFCNLNDCRVPNCRQLRAHMRRQRQNHDNMRRERYRMHCKQRRAAESSRGVPSRG